MGKQAIYTCDRCGREITLGSFYTRDKRGVHGHDDAPYLATIKVVKVVGYSEPESGELREMYDKRDREADAERKYLCWRCAMKLDAFLMPPRAEYIEERIAEMEQGIETELEHRAKCEERLQAQRERARERARAKRDAKKQEDKSDEIP